MIKYLFKQFYFTSKKYKKTFLKVISKNIQYETYLMEKF